MGSRLEILKHLPETIRKVHSGGINYSEIWTNRPLMAEAASEVRIGEISRILRSEEKKTRETDKTGSQKTNNNGFEPFVNPQSQGNQLFVNGYDGNFSQQMELDRKGIERVLKIAHLDGKVILTSLSPNQQRSIEANPDGSVTRKRNLLFGEKMEDDDKDNPLHRVVPVPQGWRIEINDRRIREELGKQKLTGKKLQKEFIKQFNGHLNSTVFECIRKEKLTEVKDKHVRAKLFWSIAHSILPLSSILVLFNNGNTNTNVYETAMYTMSLFATYALVNLVSRRFPSENFRLNVDSYMEYFMPYVEIDKVARSLAFLSIKGRNLVIETKPEAK